MSACVLLVGAKDGLHVLRYDGASLMPVAHGLQGQTVRAIAAHPRDPQTVYVGCGLGGWGLHRTADGGRSFEPLGFADRWVWDVAFHPADPRRLYVGTEPPMLYVSEDGGMTFRSLDGIEALPSRGRWTFFHAPFFAGHVHGVAIHPDRPERLFAGVEHGALIFSEDGGASWAETLVGFDIHRVAIDPADPDRVLVGAGEGLHVSPDAGRTWEAVEALRGRYVHAVAFDPHVPGRIFVYVAEDGLPLYRSEDRGRTWRGVGEGLPAARPADTVALHPADRDVVFYAGDLEEGGSQIFVSRDAGGSWRPLGDPLPKVWRMRAVAGTAR